MRSILNILLSFPKTLLFNFRYLPFSQAIRIPIWISYNTYINIKGKVILDTDNIYFAMIRLGFHNVPICDYRSKSQLIVYPTGSLLFKGDAHIGKGFKICVESDGILTLGKNFAISSNTQIYCFKKITFGNDIQFSWDCLVMDSDTHDIIKDDQIINPDKEIIFHDKVWVGCRCIILKGSIIPSNSVIGAGTIIANKQFKGNTIIMGNPAQSTKEISGWTL